MKRPQRITIREYIAWLRDEHKLYAQQGSRTAADGTVYEVYRIPFLDGNNPVVITGLSQNEALSPIQVAQYDRRMGIVSPWGGY